MRKIFCGFIISIAISNISYAQSLANEKAVQCFGFSFSALKTLAELQKKGISALVIQPVGLLWLDRSEKDRNAMDWLADRKGILISELDSIVEAGLKQQIAKHTAYLNSFTSKSSKEQNKIIDLDAYMGKKYKSLGCEL